MTHYDPWMSYYVICYTGMVMRVSVPIHITETTVVIDIYNYVIVSGCHFNVRYSVLHQSAIHTIPYQLHCMWELAMLFANVGGDNKLIRWLTSTRHRILRRVKIIASFGYKAISASVLTEMTGLGCVRLHYSYSKNI